VFELDEAGLGKKKVNGGFLVIKRATVEIFKGENLRRKGGGDENRS